jgi:hypothetical protein
MVSFAPAWSVPSGSGPLAQLAEVVHESGDFGMDVKGSDFRIGVARGRQLSGDWGVTFVRRKMKDGSKQGGIEEECQTNPGPGGVVFSQCFAGGTEYLYQDVSITGVEVNKFIPFVTIKNRVQVGVDVAGGVGAMKGTALKREPESVYTDVRNAQGQIIGQNVSVRIDTSTVGAKELMVFDPTLLGRVEIAVAAIIAPPLKVRFSGGMNFPGVHTASVTAMYFFGR